MSWGERLSTHAAADPERVAIRTRDRAWTYGALDAHARHLAAGLAGLGVRPGHAVVVSIDRRPAFAIAVCGIKQAGAVPVLVDPGAGAHARAVCAQLAPAAVVVDGAAPAARGLALPGRVVEVVAGAAPAIAPRGTPPERPLVLGPGISHVIHTSGTTAAGKSAVWSEDRVARTLIARPPVGIDDSGTGVAGIVTPLCGALGFPQLVRGLHHGATIALVDDPFPFALDTLAALGVTGLVCTPSHVEAILRAGRALPPAVRHLVVTAAPIGADRLRELAAAVAPARVESSYGLTEVGAVTYLAADELAAKAHTVGKPVKHARVLVVDHKGRKLPAGTTGHVVIRVRAEAADGYLLASDRDDRRFRGGVLWTRDRGYFDPDGYLVLEGRVTELLKVGGRLVSGPQIEHALRGVDAFHAVAVVGVPHPHLGEIAAAVYVPAEKASADVVAAIAGAVRADERPRWLIARRGLPRNATGKLRRGLVAAEARRWVALWPEQVPVGGALVPARELAAPGAGAITAIDAAFAPPPAWAGAAPDDPCARPVGFVDRATRRPVALAWLADGHGARTSGVRVVHGPFVDPALAGDARALAAVCAFLADAARALPGRRAAAVAVAPGGAGAWAGFAELAGAPGWQWRSAIEGARAARVEAATRALAQGQVASASTSRR
jgi:acyl-CoA synthetase (AMP-forming)/AMP-acid ligase II